MRTQALRAVHCFVILAAVAGCASHHRVASTQITPRTDLKIVFDSPRPVVLTAPDAEVMTLADVIQLDGRMITGTADSITIRVSSAKLAFEQTQRFGAGTTTTIGVSGARFDRVQHHVGRTILLIGALVIGAVILVAAATYEEPAPPPTPEPKPKG